MVGATPECEPKQTIACSNDYRLLVPLWRTHELYHELKESHGSYEAQHRYKVAADDIGIRPKVRDIGFHRLRANVASLIEWLRICFREGWLGNPRRNHRGTTRSFQDRGRRVAVRLAEMRARVGLLIPYGERAAELFDSAQRTPPSRRPRGAPPGQTQLDLPA